MTPSWKILGKYKISYVENNISIYSLKSTIPTYNWFDKDEASFFHRVATYILTYLPTYVLVSYPSLEQAYLRYPAKDFRKIDYERYSRIHERYSRIMWT